MLWLFPAFLRRVKNEGAEPEVVVRLSTFHELNVSAIAHLACMSRCRVGLLRCPWLTHTAIDHSRRVPFYVCLAASHAVGGRDQAQPQPCERKCVLDGPAGDVGRHWVYC